MSEEPGSIGSDAAFDASSVGAVPSSAAQAGSPTSGRRPVEWLAPGWASYFGTALAIGLGLFASFNSDPLLFMFAGMVCLCVAGVWSLAFLVTAAGRRLRFPRSHLVRWLGIPVLGLASVPLVLSGVPATARFELSRGALTEAAVRVASGQPVDASRIGLYTVFGAWRLPTGAAFEVEGLAFLDTCGFAYDSRGGQARPVDPDGIFDSERLRPLGGGWWAWCQESFD